MMRFRGILALTAVLLTGGCATVNNFVNNVIGTNQTQQVTPDQFQGRPSPQAGPAGVGQSGALDSENPRLTPSFQPVVSLPPEPAPRPPIEPETGISPVVAKTIQTASAPAGPTTGPAASTEPSVASGQYLALGGVVA